MRHAAASQQDLLKMLEELRRQLENVVDGPVPSELRNQSLANLSSEESTSQALTDPSVAP